MTVFRAVSNAGRRVAGAKGVAGLLWVMFTLLAALAVAPVMATVAPMVRKSLWGAELLKEFDVAFVIEWAAQAATGATASVIGVLVAAAAVAMAAQVLAAGGAIHRLAQKGRFFEGAGQHFWRFLRLVLISLFFYAIVIAINRALGAAAQKIWGEGMVQRPIAVFTWCRQVLFFGLLGLVATIFDYAKVRLVAGDSRRALAAAFGSTRLVLANLRKTMGAWLVVVLLGLLFFVLWRAVENAVESRSMAAVASLAAAQQLYVLSRIWIRLMFWGAAIELDGALRPSMLPPEEPIGVPVVVGFAPPERSASAEVDAGEYTI